jgi:hypothetical protein
MRIYVYIMRAVLLKHNTITMKAVNVKHSDSIIITSYLIHIHDLIHCIDKKMICMESWRMYHPFLLSSKISYVFFSGQITAED